MTSKKNATQKSESSLDNLSEAFLPINSYNFLCCTWNHRSASVPWPSSHAAWTKATKAMAWQVKVLQLESSDFQWIFQNIVYAKIQTNHPVPRCDWQKWKLADCLFVHQPHDYHSLAGTNCIRIWSHKERNYHADCWLVLENSGGFGQLKTKNRSHGLNPGLSSHHSSMIPRRIRLMLRFYGTLTPTWELRANGLIRHMPTQIRIRKSRVTMRRNPFDFLFEGIQRFKLVDSMEQLWVNFTCTWPSKMATSLTSFRDLLPKGLPSWVTPDVVQFGSHHHGLPGLSSDQTWLVSAGMHGISHSDKSNLEDQELWCTTQNDKQRELWVQRLSMQLQNKWFSSSGCIGNLR